jgi:hypothetical protein
MTLDELRSRVTIAAGGPPASSPTSGDVDARGRIAWIESRNDIAILKVAAGGRVFYERTLSRHDTTNWGYEGCAGRVVGWYGDRVVLVTQESRFTYLWSVDPDRNIDEAIVMPWAWIIDGDLAVWVDGDPGLLRAAALPSLDARPPLPYRNAPEHPHYRLQNRGNGLIDVTANHKAPRIIETLTLPTKEQRAAAAPVGGLFDLVERRLFPVSGSAVPSSARLLIEAVTEPFVRAAPWRLPQWRPAPVWISVYWYRHLVSAGRTAEARELLSVFDAIAASLAESEPERGWDTQWSALQGQIELAVRHVRRQARVQAQACRTGKLPQGWYCLFFDPAPGNKAPGSRIDPVSLPPAVRNVYQTLAPKHPKNLDCRV